MALEWCIAKWVFVPNATADSLVITGWCSSVVERRSLTGELSLACS